MQCKSAHLEYEVGLEVAMLRFVEKSANFRKLTLGHCDESKEKAHTANIDLH